MPEHSPDLVLLTFSSTPVPHPRPGTPITLSSQWRVHEATRSYFSISNKYFASGFLQPLQDGPDDEEIISEISRIKSFKAFAANAEKNGRTYADNFFTGAKDSDFVDQITTPSDYWQAVLRIHKPRYHVSLMKVIEYLATIRPQVQPSESRLLYPYNHIVRQAYALVHRLGRVSHTQLSHIQFFQAVREKPKEKRSHIRREFLHGWK